MDFLPLITIPVLYFLVALTKPYVQPKLPFKLCAICVAVSVTWLFLLVLWFLDFSVDSTVIAILMGMSVTGIMYRAEDFYKRHKIKNFWFVRLVIMLSGFTLIYEILNENWNVLILILIASVLLISITSFLFQGTTHQDVVQEQTKQGLKSSLIKKLDDCY
ncbi:MAG: hypothetical protein Q8P27_02170 [Candidatus Peregrinibacteria bacterium]|nr:hypothetical protein [Candidatus Peregrinibacteria bacterium]